MMHNAVNSADAKPSVVMVEVFIVLSFIWCISELLHRKGMTHFLFCKIFLDFF